MDALASAVAAITMPVVAKVNWAKLFTDLSAVTEDGVDPIEALASLPIGKYLDVQIGNAEKMNDGTERTETTGMVGGSCPAEVG